MLMLFLSLSQQDSLRVRSFLFSHIQKVLNSTLFYCNWIISISSRMSTYTYWKLAKFSYQNCTFFLHPIRCLRLHIIFWSDLNNFSAQSVPFPGCTLALESVFSRFFTPFSRCILRRYKLQRVKHNGQKIMQTTMRIYLLLYRVFCAVWLVRLLHIFALEQSMEDSYITFNSWATQ